MNSRTTRSRPPWWDTLATLMLVALFTGPGTWQMTRAGEKEALLAAFEAGLSAGDDDGGNNESTERHGPAHRTTSWPN